MSKLKIIAIVQARMNSARLKNKVLKKIKNQTLIDILIQRLSKSKKINDIIIATSTHPSNKILVNHMIKKMNLYINIIII